MKRIAVLVTIVFLAAGAAFAQTEKDIYRFEVGVEKGLPSVLSGPDLKDISNGSVYFAWAPVRSFQLMASYTKWEGKIAADDILGEKFATEFNEQFPQSDQIVFRDATLDQRDFEIEFYELGIVKTIPLGGKHWECFIGIDIGITNAVADVTWTGAETRLGEPADPVPSWHAEDDNSFMTGVRGGVRWIPVGWFGVHVAAKMVPIASIFDENINTLEVNGGLIFRFAKFK
jgi:hypothetical protein